MLRGLQTRRIAVAAMLRRKQTATSRPLGYLSIGQRSNCTTRPNAAVVLPKWVQKEAIVKIRGPGEASPLQDNRWSASHARVSRVLSKWEGLRKKIRKYDDEPKNETAGSPATQPVSLLTDNWASSFILAKKTKTKNRPKKGFQSVRKKL